MVLDEKSALHALQAVQSLSASEIDALVTSEIGTPMLGVFSALARAFGPSDHEEEVARRVHLMVLGYLLHREAEQIALRERG